MSITSDAPRFPQLPTSHGFMRAVRLNGPGLEPRVELVAVPTPGDAEVLLRVLAAGVCHTELQLLDGTLNPGVWPLTPGHEVAGEVALLGPGVNAATFAIGTRALVYYSAPCDECEWCRSGAEQLCPNAGPQIGLSADGGFAEFVRVPARCLVVLPAGMDPSTAAPLGCAAATAYHALYAVGQVTLNETIVVYGVGGVGLPLIQLGYSMGARVIAVSRSPQKLAQASALGAEIVDAGASDPAMQVRRLTSGEGAHAVFELVGAEDTLTSAFAMVRRGGRVVLVGYGPARLRLNPLHLILRETRVLGSVGATRAELAEVVRLAAGGSLRVPSESPQSLESVGTVLAALRAGRVLGRALLMPGLVGTTATDSLGAVMGAIGTQDHFPDPACDSAHVLPEHVGKANGRSGQAAPTHSALPTTHPETDEPPRIREPLASSSAAVGPPLEAELFRFVERGVDASRDDLAFTDLALRLFSYQFASNQPYRALCERRGRTPATVKDWREIPSVPIAAFKEMLLACEPIQGATEFNSSGTTNADRVSRHFHPSLALYDLNARLNFQAHVLPDRDRLRFMILYPPREELPHSSLAHWLSLHAENAGLPGTDWYVKTADGLEVHRLANDLRRAESTNEPVGLLAASFGLVHFLEYCQDAGLRFALPLGSRVMDTGGYKGRSREYPKRELYQMTIDLLGVPESHIVNMYGMTEHGTQFLDTTLREALRPGHGTELARSKLVPPWARTLVVDPESLLPRPRGERGLLLHVDLINRASVLAVLSEDVGFELADNRFELIGRAEASEARGCSIALDELIQAVREQ